MINWFLTLALLVPMQDNVVVVRRAAAGGDPQVDWGADASLIEWWAFESEWPAAKTSPGCDLSETGTVATDADAVEASNSALIDTKTTDRLTASCASIRLASDQSYVFWWERTDTASNQRPLWWSDSTSQVRVQGLGSASKVLRVYVDGAVNADSTIGYTSTTLDYFTCLSYDETSGEVTIYSGNWDGSGSDATWSGDVTSDTGTDTDITASTGDMTIGASSSGAVGYFDFFQIWDVALTETQCRRIFACGLDGTNYASSCTCTGASYDTTGLQADSTGLGNCNDAAP